MQSSINLRFMLESLSVSSGETTAESLAKRIKTDHDFGQLADDQLYTDLAQNLINCRRRISAKEKIYPTKSDLETNRRKMEQSIGNSRSEVPIFTPETHQTPWRDDDSRHMDEDDDASSDFFDDVDEDLKNDLANINLNQSSPDNVKTESLPNKFVDGFGLMGMAKMGENDVPHTPNKQKNEGVTANNDNDEDFGTPNSYATAKEGLDTIDRKSNVDTPNNIGHPLSNGDFHGDSDLFSQIGSSSAPPKRTTSESTPLFSNVPPRTAVPMSPPTVNRDPSCTGKDNLYFGSDHHANQSSIHAETIPPNPATAPPPLPRPTIPDASSVSFKVDLSKTSKDKNTRRSSPRHRTRGKKAVDIKLSSKKHLNQSANVSDRNQHFQNYTNSKLETPSGADTNHVNFMKSPEEMDLDTPTATRTREGKINSKNQSHMSVNGDAFAGIAFNIGAGGGTPNKKGLGNWKTNRVHKNRSIFVSDQNNAQIETPKKFAFSRPKSEVESREEKAQVELIRKVTRLRDEAKALYAQQKYKESICKYTEAIVAHTKNFTSMPTPQKKLEESETLASLYGNRAAGLMMLGAFNAASIECDKALKFLNDYNPLSLNLDDTNSVASYLKTDGGLTYMTKFLARMGRAKMKCGQIDDAEKVFQNTIRVANAALSCHKKIIMHAQTTGANICHEMQKLSERVLNQCLTDATLNMGDIARMRDTLKVIKKLGGVRQAVDTSIAQRNNSHLLSHVNKILKIAPADIRMQENKAICLASMKKWPELIRFCEVLACNNVGSDGIFTDDLTKINPCPSVPLSQHLHQHGLKHNIENGSVSLLPNQAAEAILRLPFIVAKLYIRALRLEEQYYSGQKCIIALESFPKNAGLFWSPNQKRNKINYNWLITEREKIRQTSEEKIQGDNCYREAKFKEALRYYASVLKVDLSASQYPQSIWDMETMGGRLNAVLFCNRAACLMALKRYEEAAKECSAALKIQKGYMKAIIRRARCYSRLERYEESISDYNNWIAAVEENIKNPYHGSYEECAFDRAADVSDDDYNKARSERSNVIDRKRGAEQKARQAAAEAKRRASSAYNRRQDWNNQPGRDDPRRWDPFGGAGPNRKKSTSNNGRNENRYSSKFSGSSKGNRGENVRASPSSDSVVCHYAVLQLGTSADQAEIKRAYRKMALKYHPDKNNNSDKAADVFRKIRLAYETLSDEELKRKYDVERLHQYYYN